MHAHRYRRGRETVRALFVAVSLLALLGSGSFARAADEASPVAPAATSTTATSTTAASTAAPTATATSAVQSQATGDPATLTVRYWVCNSDTDSSASNFYADGSTAPASVGQGCHAVPYLYYNEISVGLNDSAGNPLLTIASTNGTAIFQNLSAGDYQIVSDPFWDGFFADTNVTLAAGNSSVLDEIESTQVSAPFRISYRTCETDAPQAGTFAFSFNTFTSAADTTATCEAGLLPTDTSVAVTLAGTTSYGPIDLTGGSNSVQLPADTYTATLNLNGTNVATSDPITIDAYADDAGLQITHYVSRGTFPTQVPDVNGYGYVYVSSQFCTDASRDGDVSIEIGTLAFSYADATNRCQIAYGQTGRLQLVNTVTNDTFDPEYSGNYSSGTVAFYGIPGGTYVVKDLPSGAVSDPIVVTTNTYDYFAQVSYYQTTPQVGTMYVVLLNCLDNDRAGQVDFTLFDPGTVNASGTSSNCETPNYNESLDYTLTNTSTNETYNFTAYGDNNNDPVTLPIGTYTVTTSDGSVSAPFTLNVTSVSSSDDLTVLLSRYVSDAYWQGPGLNDDEGTGIDPYVYPQLCSSLAGQATGNFILDNQTFQEEAANASTTTNCQNGFAFPVQFELIPQSGDTTPIPLVANNDETAFTLPDQPDQASAADVAFYPAGLYIVHELNTNSYSAPFYLNENSEVFFLWAQAAPTATPTTVPTATTIPTETIVPTTPPTLAPGVTPSATPAPSVTVAPTATATLAAATPVPGKVVPTAAPGTKVTALPNTGQGIGGNNNSLALLLFGALSLLLLVVAFGARKQRR